MSQFNPINPPFGWEESWTKYPHGYTIYEALLDWVKTVNELISHTATLEENIVIVQNNLDNFLSTVPVQLQALAEAQLNEWLSNGTLEAVINNSIFSALNARVLILEGKIAVVESTLEGLDELTIPAVRLEQGYVTPQMYGGLGDGVANDSPAIALAIAELTTRGGGTLFFPPGTYNISEAIQLSDNMTLKGAKRLVTKIVTTANTFNAIEISSNARYVTIEEIMIESLNGIGVSNSAIYPNQTNGGANHLYRNLIINAFAYGLRAKDIWWMNRLEDVRFNACMTSMEIIANGGQSINNVFHSVYSNQPTTLGFDLRGLKTSTFIGCNFGGHASLAGRFINMQYSTALVFKGCNFEHLIVTEGLSGVRIFSTSTVVFENCTFVTNSSTGTAYEIELRDTAQCKFVECVQISPGANIKQIALYNSSRLILESVGWTDITHPTGTGSLARSNNIYAPRVVQSVPLVLNGGAQTVLLFNPNKVGRIVSVKFVYVVASSADAGITVTVRNAANTVTNASANTLTSQSAFAVQELTLNATLLHNSPLVVTTAGNKTGAGTIVVVVEYVYD